MPKYIDVDKIKYTEYQLDGGYCDTIFVRKEEIERLPPADVTEVRHAYWKWEMKIEPQAQNRLYCSLCDNECLSKDNYYVLSNYCPHCGACMDGKNEDDSRSD